jgi:hypothetical protein
MNVGQFSFYRNSESRTIVKKGRQTSIYKQTVKSLLVKAFSFVAYVKIFLGYCAAAFFLST